MKLQIIHNPSAETQSRQPTVLSLGCFAAQNTPGIQVSALFQAA